MCPLLKIPEKSKKSKTRRGRHRHVWAQSLWYLHFRSTVNAAESKNRAREDILKSNYKENECFRAKTRVIFPARRNEVYCGFSVYQNYQLMSGHKQDSAHAGITHTQLHTLERRNPNTERIYPPRPVHLSLCNGTPANSIRNIYIYLSRTLNYTPLSNHSIEPPSCFWPSWLLYRSLRSLRITFGKRSGVPSTNESWSLAPFTPKSAKHIDGSAISHRVRHSPPICYSDPSTYLSSRVNEMTVYSDTVI